MTKLRILAMADIHDEWQRILGWTNLKAMPDADICVIAGDLTNMGVFRPGDLTTAKYIVGSLCQRYKRVLWLPGNHDFGIDELCFMGLPNLDNLLGCELTIHGASVRGVSLSVAYNMPSLAYTWCHMTTDPVVEHKAFNVPYCDILVSHGPPFGVCDNDGYDLATKQTCHIGSPELTKYIERHQPKLVICGHSHGGSGEAMIGKTRVVNVARRWEVLEVEI